MGGREGREGKEGRDGNWGRGWADGGVRRPTSGRLPAQRKALTAQRRPSPREVEPCPACPPGEYACALASIFLNENAGLPWGGPQPERALAGANFCESGPRPKRTSAGRGLAPSQPDSRGVGGEVEERDGERGGGRERGEDEGKNMEKAREEALAQQERKERTSQQPRTMQRGPLVGARQAGRSRARRATKTEPNYAASPLSGAGLLLRSARPLLTQPSCSQNRTANPPAASAQPRAGGAFWWFQREWVAPARVTNAVCVRTVAGSVTMCSFPSSGGRDIKVWCVYT